MRQVILISTFPISSRILVYVQAILLFLKTIQFWGFSQAHLQRILDEDFLVIILLHWTLEIKLVWTIYLQITWLVVGWKLLPFLPWVWLCPNQNYTVLARFAIITNSLPTLLLPELSWPVRWSYFRMFPRPLPYQASWCSQGCPFLYT